MSTPRHGGDRRGSAAARRISKNWLLSPESGFGGDGEKVPCVHCLRPLAYADLERDRIHPGCSYRRTNIQPSCGPCNKARGNSEM
jgi:hypothetical protein